MKQREIVPLNQKWLYGGKYRRGSEKRGFDDSHFEKVTIPHTNKLFNWHQVDNKEYSFVSIYRRYFKLPSRMRAKRVFVEFEGISLAAEVYVNDKKAGVHKGGYTPFRFEITDFLEQSRENLLAVKVDSREREDIPPFGGTVDYLTYGGIYREVNLLAVNDCYIRDVFAKPIHVLREARKLEVECRLDGWDHQGAYAVEAGIFDGKKKISGLVHEVSTDRFSITIAGLEEVELWDIESPKLYDLQVVLKKDGGRIDHYSVKVGFRKAEFTRTGFKLNGRVVKLRGLNRHQSYPYIGYAAPKRLQQMDADLLKFATKCNIVRTSHYPQSRHFLDRCDEIGLLVFEEIPGWHNIGDEKWKEITYRNLEEMLIRDRNHPAIILWGVRINESLDDDAFYAETNRIAHELDETRQTGGVRHFFESHLLEDVFTINDFRTNPLQKPNHPLYLITEFCGHMFPTKVYDNVERVTEHVRKHADRHNQICGDRRFAGGIAWCMFDYNTHSDFGSGDRFCHHGVFDTFRFEKQAAWFYKSQCDPEDEIVLEPVFSWSIGDWSEGGGLPYAMVCSNCDTLKFYLGDQLVATEKPDRKHFGNLPRPPFVCTKLVRIWGDRYGDLRIEGFIGGKKVAVKRMSSSGLDRKFHLFTDTDRLYADGVDMTFVRFMVTDEYDNMRPYAQGAVSLEIKGPGEIIGENPFALVGGRGAVLVRSKQTAGTVRICAKHAAFGSREVKIRVLKAEKETI